jgi:hypothetical protein
MVERGLPRIALAIVSALALAPVALAEAATTTQRFTLTAKSAIAYTKSGVTVENADMRGGLGRGAILLRVSDKTNRGAVTIFTDRGSLKGSVAIKLVRQPSGSFKGTGTGRITGGTLAYIGARGTFKIAETVIPGEDVGPPGGGPLPAEPPPGQGPTGGASTKTTYKFTGQVTYARFARP